MRNAGLEEAQAGIKIARRNINNLRYADDTTLMAQSEEELKSLLMKVKEESEKVGLKLTFRNLRSWHLVQSPHGKQMGRQQKQCQASFLGGSKITVDADCRHEIKMLTPWKENYDQPRQHIKKQRHYFAYKGLSSQGYGFSSEHVWM